MKSSKDYMRIRYWKLRHNNKCTRCRLQIEPNYARCKPCRQYHAKVQENSRIRKILRESIDIGDN